MDNCLSNKNICYFVNVAWYLELHWLARISYALANGANVTIIASNPSEFLKKFCLENDILLHSVKLKRSGGIFSFLLFFKILFILKKASPDITHCITVLPNIIGGLASLFLGNTVIMSVTGRGWLFSSNTKISNILKFFVVRLYRLISSNKKSYFLFENSNDMASFIQLGIAIRPRAKLILGAGVDTKKYSPNYKKDNKYVKFLFAARFLRSKGLDVLIDAFNKIYLNNKNFTLTICGIEDSSSPDAIPVGVLNSFKNLPYVNWLGQRSDMHKIIPYHDVSVLLTRYGEGIPRILIESASCGLLSITYDLPGCNDIVIDGYNGYLLPNDSSSSDLIHLLEKVISNPPNSKNMNYNARKIVKEKFSEEIVLSETLDFYLGLLE